MHGIFKSFRIITEYDMIYSKEKRDFEKIHGGILNVLEAKGLLEANDIMHNKGVNPNDRGIKLIGSRIKSEKVVMIDEV